MISRSSTSSVAASRLLQSPCGATISTSPSVSKCKWRNAGTTATSDVRSRTGSTSNQYRSAPRELQFKIATDFEKRLSQAKDLTIDRNRVHQLICRSKLQGGMG